MLMLSSKPCSVVTSFSIDGFTYLMMDQYKTLAEAIFLKWPHVCKGYQSRDEASVHGSRAYTQVS